MINFPDPIHKNEFEISDQITITNIPQELAKNQYICAAT